MNFILAHLSMPPKEVVGGWMNRIGIILGFLSFWLVAPEFIGERRLQAWENRVETGLAKTPQIVGWIISPAVFATAAYAMSQLWVRLDMDTVLHRAGPEFDTPPEAAILKWKIMWVLASAAMALKAQRLVARVLYIRVIAPTLKSLADDGKIRMRALSLGAVLFTTGTAFQFFATYFAKP